VLINISAGGHYSETIKIVLTKRIIRCILPKNCGVKVINKGCLYAFMKNIGVIISAYNRKKYIKYALYSVLSQSLPKELYDIIVIKNYKDEDIDNYITANNVKSIVASDETTYGKRILMALEQVEGRVITFLEDDDLYEKDRLLHIYNAFENQDKFIYFHNNATPINSDGKVIDSVKIINYYDPYPLRNKLYFRARDTIYKLKPWPPYFMSHLSSQAIDRELLEKWKMILEQLDTFIDPFLFIISLIEDAYVINDPAKLTLIRLHENNDSSTLFNRSFEEIVEKKRHFLMRAYTAVKIVHKEFYGKFGKIIDSVLESTYLWILFNASTWPSKYIYLGERISIMDVSKYIKAKKSLNMPIRYKDLFAAVALANIPDSLKEFILKNTYKIIPIP
jgi:glycosyltransferase involved in cell wall biosynthesis